MAKTYTTVGWQDGEIVTPAKADLTTGIVTPAEVNGTTPVNAENLRHMDDAIKQLYDEGTTSKDIVIGLKKDTTEDTKIFIEKDSFNCLGTEVVDSLDGNEKFKSPSVRAVKNSLENVKSNEKITALSVSDFIKFNEGFSIFDNSLYKQENHIFGYIVIAKNSKFSGEQENVGSLINKSKTQVNTFGVSGPDINNRWYIPDHFAYVFLANDLTVRGNTVDTFIKTYIDYVF